MKTAMRKGIVTLGVLAIAMLCGAKQSEEEWSGWDCDEITPDLCALDVTEGEITVMGVAVKYWKYNRAKEELPSLAGEKRKKKGKKGKGKEEKEEEEVNRNLKRKDKKTPKYPIVFVHGGPAFGHNYMLPLKQLACRGREVVFYDQAGCGESRVGGNSSVEMDTEELTSQYPQLLDVSYYATQELPNLIAALKYEKFHLVGHSWGAMVAQLFALKAASYVRTKLVSLVLPGPLSDAQLLVKEQWDPREGTLSTLPSFLQQRIQFLQLNRQFDSPEHTALQNTAFSLFQVRTQPPPSCVLHSLQTATNHHLYKAIWGPDDFSCTGSMQSFNITDQLVDITVPTLLIAGKYDFMTPPVIDIMEDNIKKTERLTLPRSSHFTMIDEPKILNDEIHDFLQRVEKAHIRNKKFRPQAPNVMYQLGEQFEGDIYKGFSRAAMITSTFFAFFLGLVVGVRATWVNQQDMYQPILQTTY